jgi:hypothetical protein
MDDEASAKTAKNIAAKTAVDGGSVGAGFSTGFIKGLRARAADLSGTKRLPRRSMLIAYCAAPVIARAASLREVVIGVACAARREVLISFTCAMRKPPSRRFS